MPIKIVLLIPMPINSDHCRSMSIDSDQRRIGIDRNWSALIGIERYFGSMHYLALGIDRGSPEYSNLNSNGDPVLMSGPGGGGVLPIRGICGCAT